MSVLELQSGAMSHEIRNVLYLSTLYSTQQEAKAPGKYSRIPPEPRAMLSMDALQQAPKWPIECQVLHEKIRHIDFVPEKPEPFYFLTNTEPQPKPVGEEMGTVIYDYQPKLSVDYFCRSCVGGAEELTIFDSDPNTLKFESRFESGNLSKVIKITNVYYELYLRPDMYTDRYSQWYYFRIQNMKENVLYRFSIVNLNKPDSLYRYGLKPLMYSEKNAQINEVGWMRCGKNISYYKNDMMVDDQASSYTLTFNIKFKFNNDTVFLAQCYPYTYTKLQNYLRDIELDTFKSTLCQKRLLCKSLAGNNVYVLTITAPGNDEEEMPPNAVKKPVIVISARVHPGETPSSFMMAGIIDFITSDCSQAQELRERFIFKLIPMLNPDGTIVGNSRCCLLGQDLNRQYRTVLREAFPQIYHTKVLLRRLNEENGIFLYCDLHGHSRRNNVFIYGCENRRIPERKLSEQVFPLMLHKNAADKFSFQSCKFKIQKSKEGTGRIFVWTLGVPNSYTLEVSLGGSTLASRQYTHFSTADYEGLGRHFCESLLDYSDTSPAKEKIREKILKKLMDGGSTAEEPMNIPLTDYSSLSHSDSEESDKESGDDKDDPSKSSIKRQSSMRASKNNISPTKAARPERIAMSLTKASVDLIKIDSIVNTASSVEYSGFEVAKRRHNFSRSRSRGIRQPLSEAESNVQSHSSKKCAKLLFDDPFNLPYVRSELPEDDPLSQTEDECDQSDSDFTNQKFLSATVNETTSTTGYSSDVLVKEMSSLRLSLHTKKLTTTGQTGSKLSPNIKITRAVTVSDPPKKYSLSERRMSLGVKLKSRNEQNVKHAKSENDLNSQSSSIQPSKSISLAKQQSFLQSPSVPNRRVSWTGSIGSNSASANQGATISAATSSTLSVPQTSFPVFCRKKSLQKSKSVGDRRIDATIPKESAPGGTGAGVGSMTTKSSGKKKIHSKIKRNRSKNKIS